MVRWRPVEAPCLTQQDSTSQPSRRTSARWQRRPRCCNLPADSLLPWSFFRQAELPVCLIPRSAGSIVTGAVLRAHDANDGRNFFRCFLWRRTSPTSGPAQFSSTCIYDLFSADLVRNYGLVGVHAGVRHRLRNQGRARRMGFVPCSWSARSKDFEDRTAGGISGLILPYQFVRPLL